MKKYVCFKFGKMSTNDAVNITNENLRTSNKYKNLVDEKLVNDNVIIYKDIKLGNDRKSYYKYFKQKQIDYDKKYTEITKQKSQTKIHFLSGLLTFTDDEILHKEKKELEKSALEFFNKVCKENNLELFSVVSHYDESTPHFQAVFGNIDIDTGKSVARKFDAKYLSNLQNVAENVFSKFGFSRGEIKNDLEKKEIKKEQVNLNKTLKKRNEKLEEEYQELILKQQKIKEENEEIIKDKQKEQKKDNEILYYKKQIENIKQKAISELKKQQEQLQQKNNEIIYLKKENLKKDKEIFDLKEKLKHITTKSQKHQIERKIQNLENAEMGL